MLDEPLYYPSRNTYIDRLTLIAEDVAPWEICGSTHLGQSFFDALLKPTKVAAGIGVSRAAFSLAKWLGNTVEASSSNV